LYSCNVGNTKETERKVSKNHLDLTQLIFKQYSAPNILSPLPPPPPPPPAQPGKLAQAVDLLTCSWKAFGSNLSQDNGYPDRFMIFLLHPGKCKHNTIQQATTASFHILSNELFIIIIQSFHLI
jgi:hypothetical protein